MPAVRTPCGDVSKVLHLFLLPQQRLSGLPALLSNTGWQKGIEVFRQPKCCRLEPRGFQLVHAKQGGTAVVATEVPVPGVPHLLTHFVHLDEVVCQHQATVPCGGPHSLISQAYAVCHVQHPPITQLQLSLQVQVISRCLS